MLAVFDSLQETLHSIERRVSSLKKNGVKTVPDTEVQITNKGDETQCSHPRFSMTQCVKDLLPCHTAPKLI